MSKYTHLSDTSRVWIYQSSRAFTDAENNMISNQLQLFADQWVSHNSALSAYGGIFHRQFVVLMVDESRAGASGCSIDSSVRFLQQLASHYEVDLFDRLTFAYQLNDEVKTTHRDEFAALYQSGQITDDTLVYDNLVTTKEDFENRWMKPLKDSWHLQLVRDLSI